MERTTGRTGPFANPKLSSERFVLESATMTKLGGRKPLVNEDNLRSNLLCDVLENQQKLSETTVVDFLSMSVFITALVQGFQTNHAVLVAQLIRQLVVVVFPRPTRSAILTRQSKTRSHPVIGTKFFPRQRARQSLESLKIYAEEGRGEDIES